MQITLWHTDPCAVLLGSEQLSSQVPVLPQDPQGDWAPEEKDFVKTLLFKARKYGTVVFKKS